MKVLVIEDKLMHQQSAMETLVGHDLTIASSYDEAIKIMSGDEFPYEVVLTDMMMPMSRQTLAPDAFNSREQVPYGFVLALMASQRGARFVAMVTDTNHHQGAMSAALDHLGSAYYHEGFNPNFVINGAHAMFIHTPFYRKVLGKKTCDVCAGSGTCRYCNGTGQRTNGSGACGCSANVGKCYSCKGVGQVDNVNTDGKDWGQVLKDLTNIPPIPGVCQDTGSGCGPAIT